MKSLTLAELAAVCQGEILGTSDFIVNGVCSITQAEPNKLTYIGSDKLLKQVDWNNDTVYIIHPKHKEIATLKRAILHAEPTKAYRLVAALFDYQSSPQGLSELAVIADSAMVGNGSSIAAGASVGENVNIGERCVIGSHASIGDNVTLGDDCVISANAVIEQGVKIGHRAIIRSGAVIGGAGFGFSFEGGTWQNIPQLGSVVLGDDVEVGANSCIDRGAIEDTLIGSGVKLDNLVHIAHNVVIGDHTAIAACSGVAGSTKIGKHCMIAGRVGISGHLTICDGVQINGGATVLTSIAKPGTYAGSFYVMESHAWNRTLVYFKRLESLFRKK